MKAFKFEQVRESGEIGHFVNCLTMGITLQARPGLGPGARIVVGSPGPADCGNENSVSGMIPDSLCTAPSLARAWTRSGIVAKVQEVPRRFKFGLQTGGVAEGDC